MLDSDSDSDNDSKNNKNSADSIIQGGQHTHHQPKDCQRGTQQTTRGLPSWLTSPCSAKKLKRNRVGLQVSRLPNTSSDSLEDSRPQELLRKKIIPSIRSTVYCMSPVELYETALLILQEKAEAGDSDQVTPKDAPSSSEGGKTSPHERSIPQTITPEQQRDNRVTTSPPSNSAMDDGTATGEAKLLDDIFFIPSSTVKPPPRKTQNPQQNQIASRSPSIQSQCLAPDTVSTVPETAGLNAVSIGGKESTTGLLGESLMEHKPEGTRANTGPDLSFLDEIF